MSFIRPCVLLCLLISCLSVKAQYDNVTQRLQELPQKYISTLDTKINRYSNRISFKTEKTLIKLSKWENKIRIILEKASPETAQKLFSNGRISFNTLLERIKEGKTVTENYKSKYNDYRDKVTTTLKYLEKQKETFDTKYTKPLKEANKNLVELENNIANSEALEVFIKERKRELVNESLKYIGKSKYLSKINKEAYYYVETLRNYKEIFSDKQKVEETAITILNKIPAFQKFFRENSIIRMALR